MREVAVILTVFLVVVVMSFGASFGLVYAMEAYQCRSWHKASGDTTKIVAGECMVLDPHTGRFIDLDAYIRPVHIGDEQ